jgi:hypothetical protein
MSSSKLAIPGNSGDATSKLDVPTALNFSANRIIKYENEALTNKLLEKENRKDVGGGGKSSASNFQRNQQQFIVDAFMGNSNDSNVNYTGYSTNAAATATGAVSVLTEDTSGSSSNNNNNNNHHIFNMQQFAHALNNNRKTPLMSAPVKMMSHIKGGVHSTSRTNSPTKPPHNIFFRKGHASSEVNLSAPTKYSSTLK